MRAEQWNRSKVNPADSDVQDAQDVAASLLLRRVENMLRNGQPRQAIAHICEMTGADRDEAEAFVNGLKSRVFE